MAGRDLLACKCDATRTHLFSAVPRPPALLCRLCAVSRGGTKSVYCATPPAPTDGRMAAAPAPTAAATPTATATATPPAPVTAVATASMTAAATEGESGGLTVYLTFDP